MKCQKVPANDLVRLRETADAGQGWIAGDSCRTAQTFQKYKKNPNEVVTMANWSPRAQQDMAQLAAEGEPAAVLARLHNEVDQWANNVGAYSTREFGSGYMRFRVAGAAENTTVLTVEHR